MADSIQQQNQEKSELEIPQMRCKIHQNQQVDFIYLNTDSTNLLFCLRCAAQNVLLEEIFDKNSKEIIKNWPPLQDQKLHDILNGKEIQEDKSSQQISEIKSNFDQLRKNVIRVIDDHEVRIIERINMIEENRQNLFKIYNEISDKEEIMKLFCNNQNNSEELENNLRKVLLEKKDQSQKLQDSIDDFVKSQQSYDRIKNINEQLLEMLKSLDFLDPIQQDLFTSGFSGLSEQLSSLFKEIIQQENPFEQPESKQQNQKQLKQDLA